MDIKTKLKRSLSSVESAISSLKRARGQTTDAYHEISKAIRELEDAE